jgi:hypothetical protein
MAHDSQRYGLVDGNLVAALEMRGRINRPSVACPFCKEVCDWVAGPIVTPHIRHKSESECSAEGWAESNAHLNGKMRIIEVLREQHRIDLLVKCWRHSTSSYQWALPPWASARDEVRTPSGRVLDVALIDNRGEVVAAIEVFHSHRVDAAKAESLAQDGIPWIEVAAEVANAWVGQPFACEAMHPRVGCQACESAARERLEHQNKKPLNETMDAYRDLDQQARNQRAGAQDFCHVWAEPVRIAEKTRQEQERERASQWIADNAARIEAWSRAFAAVPCIVKVCPCGAKTPDIWTGVDQTDGTVHIDGARITYGSGDRVAWIDIDPETPAPRWLAVTRHAIAQDFPDGVPVHGLCSYCLR